MHMKYSTWKLKMEEAKCLHSKLMERINKGELKGLEMEGEVIMMSNYISRLLDIKDKMLARKHKA